MSALERGIVSPSDTDTLPAPYRGSDQIALITEKIWNGYDLDKLVDGLNPVFQYMYDANTLWSQDGVPRAQVAGTTVLDIDMDIPIGITKQTPEMEFHPSVYFDFAIHDWGNNDKRVTEMDMVWGNMPEAKNWKSTQRGLALSSHGVDVAKVPFILEGGIHGSGRYGGIYIPEDNLSTKLKVAIFLTAAQTAMGKDSIERESDVPHFKHLRTNNR